MREEIGDVFTYGRELFDDPHRIARVIPTNGEVTSGGKAIMGRGVALQAASRYRSLPTHLGNLILSHGNHCNVLPVEDGPMFVSFPTKNEWRKPADLKLIERSARELLILLESGGFDLVVMPRPGVGNGNLTWEQVGPVIRRVFKGEDRIVVLAMTDPSDPNDFGLKKEWR